MTDSPHRDRLVAFLSAPGLASALAYQGLARELGNGWIDLTDRVAAAGDERWLPGVLIGRPGTELLMDTENVREPDLRPGDILRGWRGLQVRAYWLYDGKMLRGTELITVDAPPLNPLGGQPGGRTAPDADERLDALLAD